MTATPTRSHESRQKTAQRNVEAILDAAGALMCRREQPNISAVATEAGLSRPTVYSHFSTRGQLIEALVARTVTQSMAAIERAETDRGPAIEALQRLVTAGWEEIDRHEEVARAAAAELSGDSMRSSHHEARRVIGSLIDRGRTEGVFRNDVPTNWLITSLLALIHAAAEEVRSDELKATSALQVLWITVADLFVGGNGVESALPSSGCNPG